MGIDDDVMQPYSHAVSVLAAVAYWLRPSTLRSARSVAGVIVWATRGAIRVQRSDAPRLGLLPNVDVLEDHPPQLDDAGYRVILEPW